MRTLVTNKNTMVFAYIAVCAAFLAWMLSQTITLPLVIAVGLCFLILSLAVINIAPYNVLFFFILFLPFQDSLVVLASMTGLFPRVILKALLGGKEILLITLCSYLFVSTKRAKPRSFEIFMLLFILWTALYAFLPNGVLFEYVGTEARIMGLRNTLVPFMLYFAARSIPFDVRKYTQAIKVLIIVSTIVAAFGIFEMFCMDRYSFCSTAYAHLDTLKVSQDKADERLEHIMLKDNFATRPILGRRLKRLVSFYFRPLQVAYSLMAVIGFATVFLMSSEFDLFGQKKPLFYIAYGLIWLALVLTITRAAIVGAFLEVIIICLFKKRARPAVIITLIMTLFCLPMVPYIIDYIQVTFNIADPSSQNHLSEITRGWSVLFESFWGVGLGQGGVVGGAYGQLKAGGENLYLAIGGERGIVGLGLFLLFLITVLLSLIKVRKLEGLKSFEKNIIIATFAVTVAFALTSLTTETWFGFKDAFVYWWFLGASASVLFRRNYQQPLPEISNNARSV